MLRVIQRVLPDGKTHAVQPFHVCLKGLEQAILCRDDEDYDAMVKVICVCARRKNVIVIIYGVVSNHAHVAILARSQADADAYGVEIKKIYSMLFQKKYKINNILHRIETKAICLDSDQYVRNVLAYIPKNAMDNGALVHEYPWSGYRAMFSGKEMGGRPVARLTFREKLAVMHTGDNLRDVSWLLDKDNYLIPGSFCDCEYLEQAQADSEYFKTVDEISNRWYKVDLSSLSEGQKVRLIPYLYRTTKTTAKQLARILGLSVEQADTIIRKK